MKKQYSELDGEILKIKDFLHDEFPDNNIKIYIASNNIIITGVFLTNKSDILDFKFNFFKLLGKKISDFKSNELGELSNISFNYF